MNINPLLFIHVLFHIIIFMKCRIIIGIIIDIMICQRSKVKAIMFSSYAYECCIAIYIYTEIYIFFVAEKYTYIFLNWISGFRVQESTSIFTGMDWNRFFFCRLLLKTKNTFYDVENQIYFFFLVLKG